MGIENPSTERPTLLMRLALRQERRHQAGKRRRIALLVGGGVGVASLLSAGLAYAYWTSTGSGGGSATAGSAAAVSLSPGTAVGKLYPGGSADVATSVTNPNSYAVLITGLSAGTITSGSAGNTCDSNGNGVTFNVPTSYPSATYRVPALAGTSGGPAAYVIDIPGGVSMSINSDNTCQNKTFTVPLSGTATTTS